MKNMNDVRAMLADQIQALREKTSTPAEGNAIANLTGKILSTIKLEMEYAKLTNTQPKVDFLQLPDKVTINPAKAEKSKK